MKPSSFLAKLGLTAILIGLPLATFLGFQYGEDAGFGVAATAMIGGGLLLILALVLRIWGR